MDESKSNVSGHKILTTPADGESVLHECPAEDVLRLLSGKWKPQILQLAAQGSVRFNSLLRKIPGSNKQSLSVALRELEEEHVIVKTVISEKPQHIEYNLTDRGKAMMPIFSLAARVARDTSTPVGE
jgi:DNA-binding HxlR family transcriptional regulator